MTELHTIKAIAPTWLKKHPKQSDDLLNNEKRFFESGQTTQVESFEEIDLHDESAGHLKVELGHNAGTWYVWAPHWDLPWEIEESSNGIVHPIDWNNPAARVSIYFTVGEVTRMDARRIPINPNVQKNILELANNLDAVRDWWKGPIKVTSWYRPAEINAMVGGVPNSRHIEGDAVDICPKGASVHAFQARFKAEWHDTGRWNGGLGFGADRGFVHLDLHTRRSWKY